MANEASTALSWCQKLGHIGAERLLLAGGLLDGIPILRKSDLEGYQCGSCIESSSRRVSVRRYVQQNTTTFDLTYTDMSGKVRQPTLRGAQYFLI